MKRTLESLVIGATMLTMGTLAPHCLAGDEHTRADGHSHGDVSPPKNFAEAVSRIRDGAADLDAHVAKSEWDGVHEVADGVIAAAKSLGKFALLPDSGVAKERVKELNLLGKDIASTVDAMHDAADAKKGDEVKAAHAKLAPLIAKLNQLVPAGAAGAAGGHDHGVAPAKVVFFCPMHCEGDKKYDAAGKCPVCGMALKKAGEKFTVSVKPVGGLITAGKPATLIFTLKDPTEAPVKNLDTVHEKLIHLLVVSDDLSWYAHEHPELQADGTFTLTQTFPFAGKFTLFHDFTPAGVGQQVVPVVLNVGGTKEGRGPVALTPDADQIKTVDGYQVKLALDGQVKTGASVDMAYTVSKDGAPVSDLEPYLGALGHLVIISSDRQNFVHSHPTGDEHAKAGGPVVTFHAHFDQPGLYRGWAQFQHKGKVMTVPYTFEVAQGEPGGAGEHGREHKH